MKVQGRSCLSLFISTYYLALNNESPMRVEFYRSVSRLLACLLCAASVYVTADAQTPGQNVAPSPDPTCTIGQASERAR